MKKTDKQKNYSLNDYAVNKEAEVLETKNKNNKIEIIGDALLNGLNDRGLSKDGNVLTRKYPVSSTGDMIHHVIPGNPRLSYVTREQMTLRTK